MANKKGRKGPGATRRELEDLRLAYIARNRREVENHYLAVERGDR